MVKVKDKRHHSPDAPKKAVMDMTAEARSSVHFGTDRDDSIELTNREKQIQLMNAGLQTREVTFEDEDFNTNLSPQELRDIADKCEEHLKTMISCEWNIEVALKTTPASDMTMKRSFSDYSMRLEHNINMLRDLAAYKELKAKTDAQEAEDTKQYGIYIRAKVCLKIDHDRIGFVHSIDRSETVNPTCKVRWEDDPEYLDTQLISNLTLHKETVQ
jgi:hypothetical protein